MKPHLPWVFPKDIEDEHYAAYKNGSKVVPPAADASWPTGTTPIAWHQGWESVATNFGEPCTDAKVSAFRLQYFACISFVDREIGRLLDALDATGIADDTSRTAVLFLGDHSWQLGEHNMWSKMSVFDLATRIPLLISVPWMPQSHGRRSDALVEAVDVFPTLAESAGIPVPAGEGLQGSSLLPLLANPAAPGPHVAALSQIPCCWQNETKQSGKCGAEKNKTNSEYNMCDCHFAPAKYIAFMGYSMRLDTPFPLRYTEWLRWNGTRPYLDSIFATELYNHTGDTGAGIGLHGSSADHFENANLAGRPELASLIATLSAQLRREFEQYILPY